MRSISIKIFLVLLVVSVVGALFTTFYLQFQTRNAFDAYIEEQNQSQLADQLIVHFQEYGSWENVDEVFQAFYFSPPLGGQVQINCLERQGLARVRNLDRFCSQLHCGVATPQELNARGFSQPAIPGK